MGIETALIIGGIAAAASAGAGIYTAVDSSNQAADQAAQAAKSQQDVLDKQKQTELKQAQSAAAARNRAVQASYGSTSQLDTGASKLGGSGSGQPQNQGTLLGL